MFGDLEKSRFIAYTAAFVALITLGGWVFIPFYPVPFTLQTMFVLLAGIVMKRSAVVPVLITILLGMLGVPSFITVLPESGSCWALPEVISSGLSSQR
jgi:biotin transport system substrate-specific component